MQNFQNDLQMLGMDPYHIGEVTPLDFSRQNIDDPRRCGRCGGCGGLSDAAVSAVVVFDAADAMADLAA